MATRLYSRKCPHCGNNISFKDRDYDTDQVGMRCTECLLMHRLATDQRTVAERQWQKPNLAPKPQLPCDHGLFSDDHLQLDLVEMLQEPDYE